MGLLLQASEQASATKIGGLPMGVAEFEWPTCRSCKGAMQFIAQVSLSDCEDVSLKARPQVLLVFQCQNDPGMCDDWDANSGGNSAILVAKGSDSVAVPETVNTSLLQESFVSLKPYDSNIAAETSDDNYMTFIDDDQSILGKIGGNPLWIQDDETPACDCGNRMEFVALFEERGGGGINFGGGGIGYAFACTYCEDKAKFLWQS